MRINVGRWDQIIRVVVGVLLITLAATGMIGWWGWLGVIPLITGLSRRCPGYLPFGINTCQAGDAQP